jgi:hypothetical protein
MVYAITTRSFYERYMHLNVTLLLCLLYNVFVNSFILHLLIFFKALINTLYQHALDDVPKKYFI